MPGGFKPSFDWELRFETSGERIDRATRLDVLAAYSFRAMMATGCENRNAVIVHVPTGEIVARRRGSEGFIYDRAALQRARGAP